jgi:hypothetical protein
MRFRRIDLVAALVLAAAACTDLPNEPSPPLPAPPSGAARAALQGGNGKTSLELVEDDYAGGALDKQNANLYREAALSDPSKLPAKYRSTVIGKDATYSLVQMAREWSSLSKSTQDQILDLRAKGLGDLSQTVETPHFVLHYTTTGNHAVPALDANRNGIPDFIDVAAQSWEVVWQREVVQLGYPAPLGTPAQKFHAYYKDLSTYYGATYPTNVTLQASSPVPLGTASGYIVVENDFAEDFPPNDVDVTGLETVRRGALEVTQAHEFMHAIQFNINVYQSGWLMESHATWAEDAVYDGVNDWHWYINRFLATPDLPLFSRYLYGAAFFQNWLSETYGVGIQRQIWLAARTNTMADAIRLTAFGGTFDPLKNFAAAEYTLDISDFTTEGPSVIPLPKQIVTATHDAFPVSVTVGPSTKKVSNDAPWAFGGANFVELVPDGSGTLNLTFDGADGFAWRALVVATPKNGGFPTTYTVALNGASAGSIAITGFGTKWSKVTLVPSIVGTEGAAVPYSYGATLN